MTDVASLFPKGLLRQELFLGVVSSVSATQARLNLSAADQPSGSHFESGRYGRGEVGELVLIEGQIDLVLGRVVDVRVGDSERWDLGKSQAAPKEVSGFVQFLGTVRSDTLQVSAGVANYPRLGDRVYATPHAFVGKIPRLMEKSDGPGEPVQLRLGTVSGRSDAEVLVRPEKLFGRHCAVLGATGGGKSWTVSTLVEQSLRWQGAKIIILDATGEYHTWNALHAYHFHIGSQLNPNSTELALPPSSFQESDFLALFEPSGKVQGPKFRAAIRSLRLAHLRPDLAPQGFIRKIDQPKGQIPVAEADPKIAARLEDPRQPFDVTKLVPQLEQECVYPEGFLQGGPKGAKDPTRWGGESGEFTHCLSLASRINAVISSSSLECVFKSKASSAVDMLDQFIGGGTGVMRICLGGVPHEFRAREIVANALGRHLLKSARQRTLGDAPLVLMVDEAHNFLGQTIGTEDSFAKLDAFELIAREGRKYGLNLCLATQRPRDLTEGVLSQIGTLIVHRLTNDRDREIVERACGEVDRSVTAFLANLRQGEAAIVGVDFPIPLTVQIEPPKVPPKSDGPDYQKAWRSQERQS